MADVGFGVVGAGTWGSMHAKLYASHPGAKLAAVSDTDESRGRALAGKHGARFYQTWRDLMKDPTVMAVSVVTPDFAHADIALAAAQAGKHLMVEKPLAMTVAECEQIIAAAKSTGAKLMVDFHARWSPPFYKAWEAIQKGQIGEPRHAYYRLNDRIWVPTEMLSWAAKSTVEWFIGSHGIDTVRWLFGDEVRRVYAVAGRRVLKAMGIDTPDYYQVTLEFRRGATAVIENSWIMPNSMPNIIDLKCQVVGSKGAVYVDGSHHRAVEKYTQEDAGYPDVFVMPAVYDQQMGFAAESIRHFADCVVHDKQPMVTGEDGLQVTKVICAVEESVATGMPVEIA